MCFSIEIYSQISMFLLSGSVLEYGLLHIAASYFL
jgi:hypothetical protein